MVLNPTEKTRFIITVHHLYAFSRPCAMPPKTAPLPQKAENVQNLFNLNPNFLLPSQSAQFQKIIESLNELQSRKVQQPNNPDIDQALAELRNQLQTIIRSVNANEATYKTPEAFKQYAAAVQTQQQAAQRAAANAQGAPVPALGGLTPEKFRALQVRLQEMKKRVSDIDAAMGKADGQDKMRLIQEQTQLVQQIETITSVFRNAQAAAAGLKTGPSATQSTDSQSSMASGSQPGTPTIPQPQMNTPGGGRNPGTPVGQQSVSQDLQANALRPPASIGPIARPSTTNTIQPLARPTLSGGYPVGSPLLGTAPPSAVPQAFHVTQDGDTRLLSKRKLQDLVKSIDPEERLEPDAEELLMEVADEFIDSVLQQSCKIARHRRGQMLEVRDVQLHLERNWNIRIPGYAAEDVKTAKKYNPTVSHTARLAAVNQAKAMQKE
jgi:transcription initiation factor TFIID subunit TAF12